MRRKLVFVVILAVLAGLILFGYTRTRSKAEAANTPQRGMGQMVVPVAIAQVSQKDMPVYLDGLGSVQAFNTVTLKTRVDGEVTEVAFREGQDVRKGELLIVIDPRPYKVALEQAQATLFRDQSQLTIAKRNVQRYSELFKEGVVSQQDLDTQQSTEGNLEGMVRADQAAVDNAKLNLTYTHITAPFDGRVGLRLVDPGNIVHATDTSGMLVLTQMHPIAVIFTLPEDSLPPVLKRLRQGPMSVDVYSRDNRTHLSTGSLLTVNNQIDQTTGTVRLKAVFENRDSMLWPNQFVNARLLLDTQKNATVVPAAAVQRGAEGTYAYVVKPDNTVEVRQVKVGVTDGNLIAVNQGLEPGDKVVTDGQDKLQAGSRVRPISPAASSNDAARFSQVVGM
ncbi:MAG TPA: MdtA/MuxA family multidrug efflux RND transporter periplasmic adaptor subunit [Terriglobales bacterium]|nr:MdtA/MuxA family multidrug efflux RND transporter periplasmic adaptor subunit [Terriglobales bacterium]